MHFSLDGAYRKQPASPGFHLINDEDGRIRGSHHSNTRVDGGDVPRRKGAEHVSHLGTTAPQKTSTKEAVTKLSADSAPRTKYISPPKDVVCFYNPTYFEETRGMAPAN